MGCAPSLANTFNLSDDVVWYKYACVLVCMDVYVHVDGCACLCEWMCPCMIGMHH